MPKVLEKVERRLGEKLLLKGDRCFGPKCAAVRRNYPPGAHGKSKRRGLSEYGQMLREKQKIRFLYGLDDKDVQRYTELAQAKQGVFSSNFLQLLEQRLDNTVFRLGFAPSRRVARHLVSYGHIKVKQRMVNVPSFRVKKGDTISIRDRSLGSPLFADIEMRLKKYDPPQWLGLDKDKKIGRVVSIPETGDLEATINAAKIKEFYSR